MAVQVDFAGVREVIQRCDVLPRLTAQSGIRVFDADVDLLEAVVRLLRLLDRPEDAKPLAPLLRQEILYRLLSSPSGSRLLEICRNGSLSSRIAGAIAWLQQHFAEGFMVAELAHHMGMSPSSFHQHFKAATGMTSIRYQKRIRLQQARRSLLLDSMDVGEASLRVGYQSHSQFSKDYRQYFGRLPKHDVLAHSRREFSIEAYTRDRSFCRTQGQALHSRLVDNGLHRHNMALIVFFRGINVGGHRTFRPSTLATDLDAYDVVNVGAAGTLVVRKPGSRAKFLAALRRKLPFEAEVAFCDGRDLIRLEMENPFGSEPSRPDVVRFVSILSKAGRGKASLPIALPEDGEWFVRIIGSKNRLVFGVYRRHMKTIGYLGRIDDLFGVPATTRSWNTILTVLRILKAARRPPTAAQ